MHIHCVDCDREDEGEANHGMNELAAVIALAPKLVELQKAVRERLVGVFVDLEYLGFVLDITFLERHNGHKLRVKDEYGDFWTWTGPADWMRDREYLNGLDHECRRFE